MTHTDDIRWKQRLKNFENAVLRLSDACQLEQYTDLERVGLIGTFNLCFELSWKVLKDILIFEGYNVNGPRTVIRMSFEANYLDETDCEIFLKSLEERNVLIHVYDKSAAMKAESLIKHQYFPSLSRLCNKLIEKASQ